MAWLLLITVIVLSLLDVALTVVVNNWYRDFYDTLQHFDFSRFLHDILVFCGIAALYILAAVYRTYLTQMLTLRWRRWLTQRYFARWLSRRNYYHLEQQGHTDNPDQRLADDINDFTDTTLSLGLGLLTNAVSMLSFSVILWNLSGSITLFGVEIPGYMFWASLIYASLGSWLTHLIARRLIGLNNRQQKMEADMRFGLIRVRENAESIALYGGERHEQADLITRFEGVWSNFLQLMKVQRRLTFFSSGYGQIATIFPFVVAAPHYFAKQIELGQLMQIVSAFGNVQGAMSWFIDSYATLAAWRATSDRIIDFDRDMRSAEQSSSSIVIERAGNRLEIQDLSVRRGHAAPLLSDINLRIDAGEHVLIGGPSGSGKSTLLRVISGLWREGEGRILMPAETWLFIPQRPYLPIGTLGAALSYPGDPQQFTSSQLEEALSACRLSALIPQLHQTRHWQRQLSPGEQQRLAIARVLLQQPRWLFLDESTSALDEADEAALYGLIRQRLPQSTLVSVGHRNSLRSFHRRFLQIASGELTEG